MNAKELIVSQPPAAIAALLLDKFHAKPDDRERAMKRLVKFIEGLNQIKPVDSGHLILGIFHVDEDGDFLDPCLYCKEELEAGCRADSELASLEDIEELTEEEIERLAHIRDFPESNTWGAHLHFEVRENPGTVVSRIGPVDKDKI